MIEIATQHVLGVVQHDLHLNNFLMTKKKIYTLDGAQVELFPPLLSKKKSMGHLALFLSQLGVGVEECQENLFHHYANARGWLLKKQDYFDIFYLIKKWDGLRWRRYEKKIFRDCTHFSRSKNWYANGMLSRRHALPELTAFAADPESIFNDTKAEVLKAGRSTTVRKIVLDKKTYVIKRYNLKNMWHRLRRCLRPTRAATCWRLAHKLNLFGVPTAAPVAFIEKNILGFRGKSYSVTEYISSEHVGDYLRRHQADAEKSDAMIQRVAALLKNLAKLEITHGDLKMTNILIDAHDYPVLIDLDGASEHATLSSLKNAWRKDIQRFLRNFDTLPEVRRKFEIALVE